MLRQVFRQHLTVLSVCLLAVFLLAAGPPARLQAEAAAQPGGVTALHRSGQTFLTWQELAGQPSATYRIYRHTQPITGANLPAAQLLAEVPAGSGRFYANRYNVDSSGTWAPRYYDTLVVADGGAPLPAGTGLLVWTLAAADFGGGTAGNGYYAVTAVAGGVEDTTITAANRTIAVAESVANPQPVEIAPPGLPSNGHLYIQYMDLRRWNATFHAPNALNNYYGLDGGDPAIANALQYMYDYAVYAPTAADCGGSLPANLPVVLILHGWGDNAYAPQLADPDPWGWCAYRIYPIDTNQTWWFGFAQAHDYRTGLEVGDGDQVANFTEQRVLRMVYDLLAGPPGPHADPDRVFVYGHSMGGSGTLALALRYPNVFAAAYASEPMTDYATSGDGGGTDWRGDVQPKWGSVAQNLPVVLAAPGDWAAPLASYAGTGVYDWQNHQATLASRRADGFTPLGIGHGLADTVIEWSTQGQPVYAALDAAATAYGGAVADADHTWLAFLGLPPTLGTDSSLRPFYSFAVVRDETVPGLANNSGNLAIPPPGVGRYHHNLRWSASWDPWDGAPVDNADQWAMSFCYQAIDAAACGSGTPLTVDITPRRVQQFVITAGASYRWENRRVADGALTASGVVTASSAGLLTVPGFALEASGGNRLILRPSEPISGTPAATVTPTATSTNTPSPTPTVPGLPTFAPTATSTPTATGTPVLTPSITATPAEARLYLPTALKPAGEPTPARTITPTGAATATATPTPTTTPTSTPTGTRTPTATPSPRAARPWPETSDGIYVFNDQLATGLSDAQWNFAATHYVGTQKVVRGDAVRLRTANPGFLILHYRLGLGLGYRSITGGCTPGGDYLHIIEGDAWVREWPPEAAIDPSWFYALPGQPGARVLNCDWGWYLMDLADAGWRDYWQGEVLRQIAANDDDGVFMDSLNVPNYLGADRYDPSLPAVDASFETAWAQEIDNWLALLQAGPVGAYAIVPNAGSWITSRDPTTYAAADGVMIEGFALWADDDPFTREDWELQMDRVVRYVAQDKLLIAQSYVTSPRARMFALGSYLLIKGSHSYINLELGEEPEWWPEYAIDLGEPLATATEGIAELASGSLYRRDFANGLVLVNPGETAATVTLASDYRRAEPQGGGFVPENGIAPGTLTYTTVRSVTLEPYSAAVVVEP